MPLAGQFELAFRDIEFVVESFGLQVVLPEGVAHFFEYLNLL